MSTMPPDRDISSIHELGILLSFCLLSYEYFWNSVLECVQSVESFLSHNYCSTQVRSCDFYSSIVSWRFLHNINQDLLNASPTLQYTLPLLFYFICHLLAYFWMGKPKLKQGEVICPKWFLKWKGKISSQIGGRKVVCAWVALRQLIYCVT